MIRKQTVQGLNIQGRYGGSESGCCDSERIIVNVDHQYLMGRVRHLWRTRRVSFMRVDTSMAANVQTYFGGNGAEMLFPEGDDFVVDVVGEGVDHVAYESGDAIS